MPEPARKHPGITLRLERRFPAPREKVFRAWTQPEALKKWWCPSGWTPTEIEVDLRVGGSYRIGMRQRPGGSPVYVRGEFVEVRPPERLVYTWRWDGALADMRETRVTVEFRDAGQATEIVLTHENFPDPQAWHQHRMGWIAACDRMERIL
jgi:uncharacterized protein YndB with AHSA1/START domain